MVSVLLALSIGAADLALPRVAPHAAATEIATRLTTTTEWLTADPTWGRALGSEAQRFDFGAVTLVRIRPWLETGSGAAPVEGADRLVRLERGAVVAVSVEAPLAPEGRFAITEAMALSAAVTLTRGAVVSPADATRLGGFARRVWLTRGGAQRPAWRVRVPTLRLEQLRDVWIDAESGELLLSRPVARFQAAAPSAARLFDPAPAPGGVDVADLVDRTLPDLLPAAPGGPLSGYHVATHNCCKHYVCEGGAQSCDEAGRTCVDAAAPGAIESAIAVALPTSSLPFDPAQIGFTGDTMYVRSVLCTERPHLQSEPHGWFPTPIDSTRAQSAADGAASEVDTFVELELYWSTRTFFEHVRSLLGATFCLRDTSMLCDAAGAAALDGAGVPLRAFHVSGNQLMPAYNMQDLGLQIFGGHGLTAEDPLVISDYQRVDNAAFVPALEGSPIQVPPELAPLLGQFNRSYDSNMYFQGARDFGYDGDIVFHEFTHAVVWTLVPDLANAGFDRWGSHVEPGAMNEGWSDYFSASYTDDPLTGEYAGEGMAGSVDGAVRNLDNTKRCPDDIIGEVHADSEPWSGALWEIREALRSRFGEGAIDRYGQRLLLALAASDATETFYAQAERVALELDSEFGAEAGWIAAGVFMARGLISCERALTLAPGAPHAKLMQPSPEGVGLTDWAPSVVQLRIDAPAGSTSFELRFSISSGAVGGFGGAPASPAILISEGGPIEWRYDAGAATPYNHRGVAIPFDPALPDNHPTAGGSAASFGRQLAPSCEPRSFWISFVASESSVYENLEVILRGSDLSACADGGDPDDGCSSTGAPAGFAAMGLSGLLLRRRRLRQRNQTTG